MVFSKNCKHIYLLSMYWHIVLKIGPDCHRTVEYVDGRLVQFGAYWRCNQHHVVENCPKLFWSRLNQRWTWSKPLLDQTVIVLSSSSSFSSFSPSFLYFCLQVPSFLPPPGASDRWSNRLDNRSLWLWTTMVESISGSSNHCISETLLKFWSACKYCWNSHMILGPYHWPWAID